MQRSKRQAAWKLGAREMWRSAKASVIISNWYMPRRRGASAEAELSRQHRVRGGARIGAPSIDKPALPQYVVMSSVYGRERSGNKPLAAKRISAPRA